MSESPRGWVEATIGDVCSYIQRGKSPKYTEHSDLPIVNQKCVRWWGVDERHLKFVDPEQWPSWTEERFLAPGDVLWNSTGTGTIGRAALFRGLTSGSRVVVDSHVTVLRPSGAVSGAFLHRFIQSPTVQDAIADMQSGTTNQVELNRTEIVETAFPLPPMAEQKRIVAKLDALNANSERARTELARIETLVSRYKQAVLGKAFSGELTSGIGQGTSVATLDANPDVTPPWSVPETWSWCRTDQVGRVGLGRQRSPKNHEGPQMRPYLRSANITWQGVDTSDVKEMNFDDADFKRFKLEVGDVLLNEGSGSAKEVGKPAIWRGEIADCCYQNTLLRVQPHRCSSEYLYYYFLLTARAGRFVSSIQGVNIQHIGREGLACYPFPLAPEPEQHEIVRRIESAFAKIDRLAGEAKRALELVGRLDEAILAKAFRGELVPQDESDEPASALLEKIRRAPMGESARPKRKASATKGKVPDMARTILETLTEAKDWLGAQELFARCGVRDGSSTEDVEKLYRQLLDLERQEKVEIEEVADPATGAKQGDRVRLRK